MNDPDLNDSKYLKNLNLFYFILNILNEFNF